jgi:chromosome segregation ATPase
MDEADIPMEHLDQLQSWDVLVSASRSIQTSITVVVQHTDQAVKTLQTTAEKYPSNPAKVRALNTQIESLQENADRLILLDAALTRAITGVVARLEKVHADPEVQQALAVQATMDRTRSALDRAATAASEELKP